MLLNRLQIRVRVIGFDKVAHYEAYDCLMAGDWEQAAKMATQDAQAYASALVGE